MSRMLTCYGCTLHLAVLAARCIAGAQQRTLDFDKWPLQLGHWFFPPYSLAGNPADLAAAAAAAWQQQASETFTCSPHVCTDFETTSTNGSLQTQILPNQYHSAHGTFLKLLRKLGSHLLKKEQSSTMRPLLYKATKSTMPQQGGKAGHGKSSAAMSHLAAAFSPRSHLTQPSTHSAQ